MEKKNKTLIYILISFAFLGGCSSPKSAKKFGQEYKTKYFKLFIPDNWKIKSGNGIDSQVSDYFISEKDTIFMDVSSYANNLAEHDPDILPKSVEDKVDSTAKAVNHVIFIDDKIIKKGIDIDNYRKQNVSFKNVSGRYRIKITVPRITEDGVTGMYCDSIGMDDPIGRVKMNIYGKNLKEKTADELLEAINNIKFN